HRCELALVAPARDASRPAAPEDQRYPMSAAAAAGATFVRPGAGPAASVHRRRFAAPGRSLAAASPGCAGAGACAMLGLQADRVERAAALAGEPLVFARPPVIGVCLDDDVPADRGGAEIVHALAAEHARRCRGAVLEFHGRGLASLPMHERIAVATLAPALLGAFAVVFPSDARTRAALRVLGREPDWRSAEGACAGFDEEIALATDALAAPPGELSLVRVSALAEDDDVAIVARAAAAARVRPAIEVVLGGRAAQTVQEREGVLEQLRGAGAVLFAPESPEAQAPSAAAFVIGDDPFLAPGPRHLSARAFARAAGADGEDAAPPAAGPRALDEDELIAPPAVAPEVERSARHRVPSVPPPLMGTLRATVLLEAGDHARCDRILAWGPRTAALRGDAGALAEYAFRAFDERFAARCVAHGGGVVVAGTQYGAGEPCEHAARVTAALGIRAVIAQSFAGRHARALASYGVLPLVWRGEPADPPLRAGDEIEIVDVAEAIGSRRVALRHLTGGWQWDVGHDLDARALEVVRAGGLLGWCARAGERAGVERS
ncbi:MAG: hypothetical protein HZA61_05050, partial [Candidatus Eisenbacteria bacterium]|nr:hypothetical protein [Candidatus Eisenbacteria bacterium]